MRLAVLGTPCGGTGYATVALRQHGLDVGHEDVGTTAAPRRDGIVCGFAALGRGPKRDAALVIPTPAQVLAADHVVRLIRHPLDVAETLPGVIGHTLHPIGRQVEALKRSRAYRRSAAAQLGRPGVPDGRGGLRPAEWHEGGPVVLRTRAPEAHADELRTLALRFWVRTHEAIPSDVPVVRLATVEADLAEHVLAPLGIEPRRYRAGRGHKERRWSRWTWEQWATADPGWARRGRDLWERYGAPERGAP